MDVAQRRQLHVTVVARQRETVDGLCDYLGGAGVRTTGATDLAHLSAGVPADSVVVVVFPDDFMFLAVAAEVASLRTARADMLVVLVTNDARRFEALPTIDTGYDPVVIPKPAWGWTILETIHARLEAGPLA